MEKHRKAFHLSHSSRLEGVKTVFYIFIIILVTIPIASYRFTEFTRERLIEEFEKKHKAKVLLMVHRVEKVGFFGIPIREFIQERDAESILSTLQAIPPETPIILILHTPGGEILPSFQIARALKKHPGKVTVYIPHYAMSGGTLIALAADRIVMSPNAALGPVDPQINWKGETYPAISVLKAINQSKEEGIVLSLDDMILADLAYKSLKQVEEMVRWIFEERLPISKVDAIVKRLIYSESTHDAPIFPDEAKKLGLPIETNLPKEVFELIKTAY